MQSSTEYSVLSGKDKYHNEAQVSNVSTEA